MLKETIVCLATDRVWFFKELGNSVDYMGTLHPMFLLNKA